MKTVMIVCALMLCQTISLSLTGKSVPFSAVQFGAIEILIAASVITDVVSFMFKYLK